jgi:predicted nucleic acid-binding protein
VARRVLLDTNVLVALSEPRDERHGRAAADYVRLARAEMLTTTAAIAEACFVLPHDHQRERLRRVLVDSDIRLYPMPQTIELALEVFDWLRRYASNRPDWTDALYVILSSHERPLQVWSYDAEFATIWRRPDGTRIPLAVRA